MHKMGWLLSAWSLALFGTFVVPISSRSVGRTRHYYLAAEEIEWDYGPTGQNRLSPVDRELDPTNMSFASLSEHPRSKVVSTKSNVRIGTKYWKVLFQGYTDDSFTTKLDKPKDMGLLGPVIRAEVGDRVKVHFWNKASHPYTIHPLGLRYDANNEGSVHPYAKQSSVAPGDHHTYVWTVPEQAGPTTRGLGHTKLWHYQSHATRNDIHVGLVGPIVVYPSGALSWEKNLPVLGTPQYADREIFLSLMISDENRSWMLSKSMSEHLSSLTGKEIQKLRSQSDFQESNRMYTFNGFIYGNLPMVTLTAGQRVRWYLLALGEEVMKTVRWHGPLVRTSKGDFAETVLLASEIPEWVDMTADVPGTWAFYCPQHSGLGMAGWMNITEQK